jgi:hypothetical protein
VAAQDDVLLGVGELEARGGADALLDDVDPVTSSVTGCSTCTRVFISRKKYSPVSALSRPSIVPAPT